MGKYKKRCSLYSLRGPRLFMTDANAWRIPSSGL